MSGKCRNVCSTVNNKKNCEAICSTDKPGNYVKVYAAAVMPLSHSGSHVFDLCQEYIPGGNMDANPGGNCVVSAGSVTGSGDGFWDTIKSGEVVDDENFHIIEVDVTDVLVKKGWSFLKPLDAFMSIFSYRNLPEPVMVIKTFGKGGKLLESKLRINALEKRERYGNLLDKYSKKIKAERI